MHIVYIQGQVHFQSIVLILEKNVILINIDFLFYSFLVVFFLSFFSMILTPSGHSMLPAAPTELFSAWQLRVQNLEPDIWASVPALKITSCAFYPEFLNLSGPHYQILQIRKNQQLTLSPAQGFCKDEMSAYILENSDWQISTLSQCQQL